MNILISDISSYKAIVVAKFIKDHYDNVRIISFDERRFTKFCRTKNIDKHFCVNVKSLSHVDIVKKLIREESIDRYLPISSTEMEILMSSDIREINTHDYLGSYDSFKTLNQKNKLQRLAKTLNIKTPKTFNALNNANTPCVIKPIDSSSAKGVEYIFSNRALEKAKIKYKNKSDFIIQAYIRGTGVGFSVFAKNGRIVCSYGHKRLAEFPISGGSSVYREHYQNEQMKLIAEKILMATKWTGFAMFEFKLTPENELYFLEVNPRIWGSINQGLQNGINYFTEIFGTSDNHVSPERKDIKTYISPLIYWALLRYVLKFNFTPIATFLRNIPHNEADISFVDDFKGWLSMILRKIL